MSQTTTILPDSTVHNDGSVAGGPTLHAVLQTNDGDTTRVSLGSDGYIEVGMGDIPAALAVLSVTLTASYSFFAAVTAQKIRLFITIGGVKYYSGYTTLVNLGSGNYANVTFVWTLDPSTTLPFTPPIVNSFNCGVDYADSAAESVYITYLAATVAYVPVPVTVDVTRHIGSVALWLKKRPEAFLQFEGNLDLLNLTLLDLADIEHTAGPHATDLGWEREAWQRRPFALHEMTIDLNEMTVSAKFKDQRPIRCLLRDLAWSDKASGSLGDGIATFATPGSVRTFTRASEHTFTNPVGESETVPTNIAAYGPYGLFMLSASGGRAAPRYKWTNNSGSRVWLAAQGGFVCEVYLAAVSGVANQTVAYAYHDASNWHHVYWDGANGRWVFEVRVAGTTVRAVKSASPSANTVYQIGARWTGSNLELGATAYTASVWVDRVKGTDAVSAAAMTEQATADLDFGSKAAAGTEQLNGQIRKIHVFQYVPTDVEMARQI